MTCAERRRNRRVVDFRDQDGERRIDQISVADVDVFREARRAARLR